MKKFTCSEELADIFLKNGFTDISAKVYPKHVDKAIGVGKRAFKPPFKTRGNVEFDYINLVSYGASFQGTTITEDELKALILFNKLNYNCFRFLASEYGLSIDGILRFTKNITEEGNFLAKRRPKLVFQALEAYDSIKL